LERFAIVSVTVRPSQKECPTLPNLGVIVRDCWFNEHRKNAHGREISVVRVVNGKTVYTA
jgi:hypothetical protein